MDNIYHQLLWEKHYWLTMQSYVYNYPNIPDKANQKNMYNTFIQSGFLIPHEYFRKQFFIYLENISIVNFLENKQNLMNYLFNLYVFIFNKTKEYVVHLKQNSNVMEDELINIVNSEPKTFDDFWSSYVKIYTPPPPKLSYEKLLYTQSIMHFIIVSILFVFIFYIYKHEIRNFFNSIFRNFFI